MSSEALLPQANDNSASSRSQRKLLGHVIIGTIQLAVGIELVFLSVYCLLGRRCFATPNDKDKFPCYNLFEGPKNLSMCSGPYCAVVYDGFWSGPFFIAAGATGLAASRGGSKTLCCIIICIVLSILATGVGFVALAFHVQGLSVNYGFADDTGLWLLLYVLAIVTSTLQAGFLCGLLCCGSNHFIQHLQTQATPDVVQRRSSYASRVPPRVLKGSLITGTAQITLGLHLIFMVSYCGSSRDLTVSFRNSSGSWSGPVFLAAGTIGVAGGRGRGYTQCYIISCLVLSILAFGVGLFSVIYNFITVRDQPGLSVCIYSQPCFTPADILWFLLYLLESVVATVQVAFACRASCCCLPDASGQGEATPLVSDSDVAGNDAGFVPADGQPCSGATDSCETQPPPYRPIEACCIEDNREDYMNDSVEYRDENKQESIQ